MPAGFSKLPFGSFEKLSRNCHCALHVCRALEKREEGLLVVLLLVLLLVLVLLEHFLPTGAPCTFCPRPDVLAVRVRTVVEAFGSTPGCFTLAELKIVQAEPTLYALTRLHILPTIAAPFQSPAVRTTHRHIFLWLKIACRFLGLVPLLVVGGCVWLLSARWTADGMSFLSQLSVRLFPAVVTNPLSVDT